MARSLLVTGALLGMDVRIAAPRELWPPDDVQVLAADLATHSGARILVTDDVTAAVSGAAFVHTDVWVSMGEGEDEWTRRVPLLTPYRVTADVLARTNRPDVRFMHCLPAVHDTSTELGHRLHVSFGLDGAEVTDDVFTSPASVAFHQAENRMHTIKALLVASLA
jgi:ornithine carbamoyltransferase